MFMVQDSLAVFQAGQANGYSLVFMKIYKKTVVSEHLEAGTGRDAGWNGLVFFVTIMLNIIMITFLHNCNISDYS